LDIRDAEAVNDLIADYQPDVTFLAAGLTDAGYSELHPEECHDLTVQGTATVAAAVAKHGGTLTLFSSDTVFGECRTAKREEDHVCPRGALAEAKVRAEALVRVELPKRHTIIRTGWVFGAGERSRGFADRFVRPLLDGEAVQAATDRYGQPTFATDLAEVALDLAQHGPVGTIHVVGPERHTEFTFARLTAHVFGIDTDLVDGVTAADLHDADPRPNRVWLDRYKLRTVCGAQALRSPADGLRALRDSLVESPSLITLRVA
jgi:dTDP-4-dehydrorhamnose reductase